MFDSQNKAPLTAVGTVHRSPQDCRVHEGILQAEPDQNQTCINCLISGQFGGWPTTEIRTSPEAFEHIAYYNKKAFPAICIFSSSTKSPCQSSLRCQSSSLVKRDIGKGGKAPPSTSSVKPPLFINTLKGLERDFNLVPRVCCHQSKGKTKYAA